MEKIVVEEENIRLDQYISNILDISRSNKVEKGSYLVKIGDELTINDLLDFSIKVQAKDIKLDILYEDQYLMIINKKSGMVVHPAPGHYDDT